MAQVVRALFQAKILQNFRNTQRFMCNLPQTNTSSPDFLLNNLKNALNTKSVLEMVAQHNDIMNNKHIVQALRSLFTLQKCGSTQLSTRQILNNPDFRRLCQKLRSQAGTIELNDAIEALKVVSYVGVPADSTITQVLLQLIRHNVNQLSLQQILFLDFLIYQFKSSPLVEALKIALPLVFEIHLPVKMDYNNVPQLAEYLFYTTRNPISNETRNRIANALMACNSDYDAKTAKSLVWSICDLDNCEELQPLLKKALNSLVVHFDDLTFVDVETTLSKLSGRFSRRTPYFYNEVLYDSCANYVIDNDLGFMQAVYILRKFARVNHHSRRLLDYMVNKVYENPELITKTNPVELYSIVISMAMTTYRPKNWDFVKNLIAQSEDISQVDKREIIWIKFASSLCLLDIYKVDVLNKALSETFLQNLFKRKFRSDFENYYTCWESIKTFKPELNCILSQRFNPEILVKRFQFDFDYPMEAALQKGFGGDNYVATELYSNFGFRIDHAILFRKGGFAVANGIPEDLIFIEDFEQSPDNQLVLIKGIQNFNYTLNTKEMLAGVSRSIQILENKGFIVVPISLEVWENLPDFEKIPYLMQNIKEKIGGDLDINTDVV